ncbi:MAG: right-handed parallel beta-helix repeat-containing protein, partial [Planctomycetota bacterium]|nr:right-handed parallel beta-helix repeat-containing protein [Planctomycetota bacterium]
CDLSLLAESGVNLTNEGHATLNFCKITNTVLGVVGTRSKVDLFDCRIKPTRIGVTLSGGELFAIKLSVERPNRSGVELNSATAYIEDLTVVESEDRGIGCKGARVCLQNPTILKCKSTGIHMANSTMLVREGRLVSNGGGGMRVERGSKVYLNRTAMKKLSKYAISISNSELTANCPTIENTQGPSLILGPEGVASLYQPELLGNKRPLLNGGRYEVLDSCPVAPKFKRPERRKVP